MKSEIKVPCNICKGTGHKPLKKQYSDTLTFFGKSDRRTCASVRDEMILAGLLKKRSKRTIINKRAERLEEMGLLKRHENGSAYEWSVV